MAHNEAGQVVVRQSWERRPPDQVSRVFRHREHGVITVVSQTAQYISEDGMSFGLESESGWLVYLTCRPATPQEAAPILAEVAEQQKAAACTEAYKRLFRAADGQYIREESGQIHLFHEGVRVPWREGFTMYGGGEEFVLIESGPHAGVWHLINNGADGDDWLASNVASGGAGAIGRRYETTPERLAFLRSLPGGDAIGKTKAELRRAMVLLLRAHVQAPAGLFEGEPIDADTPTPAVWVLLDGALVGMPLNESAIWLACRPSYEEGMPRAYEHGIWSDSGGRVYLRYEATPERVAACRALWPSWVGTAAPGRYVLETAFGAVCENAADAIREANRERVPAHDVRVTPDVIVVYASPRVASGMAGVLIWSDAHATRVQGYGGRRFASMWRWNADHAGQEVSTHVAELRRERDARELAAGFPEIPEPPTIIMSLSTAAVKLLGIALSQETWRAERRFERLCTVMEEVSRERLEERGRSGSCSSEEVELHRLVVRHAASASDDSSGPREQTLWLVEGHWGAMGEDGDAGDDAFLFEDEAAARAEYKALYVTEGT